MLTWLKIIGDIIRNKMNNESISQCFQNIHEIKVNLKINVKMFFWIFFKKRFKIGMKYLWQEKIDWAEMSASFDPWHVWKCKSAYNFITVWTELNLWNNVWPNKRQKVWLKEFPNLKKINIYVGWLNYLQIRRNKEKRVIQNETNFMFVNFVQK